MRSNYTGWRTAEFHISILVCKQYQSAVHHSVYTGSREGGHSDPPSSLRPCRGRQQISPRRLYHVQHYTVSQNPNSAQLTVPVSVAACREYVNELPQPEKSFFHVAGDGEKAAELGDFPHMVSGQATRCYRTKFRSRSQANVQFI